MKRIACVSFTSSQYNFEQEFEFLGQRISLRYLGADFDADLMGSLIDRLDSEVDVLALQGLHPPVKLGRREYVHHESHALLERAKQSKVVTGDMLRQVLMPWVLRGHEKKHPGTFANKRIAFYSGVLDSQTVRLLGEYSKRLCFMDPYLHMNLRKSLKSPEALERYSKFVLPRLLGKPLNTGYRKDVARRSLSGLGEADIYFSRASMLERFSFEQLAGKSLVTDTLSSAQLRQLKEVGLDNIYLMLPDIEGLEGLPVLNFPILEAILQALKAGWQTLSVDDILDFTHKLELKPELRVIKVSSSIKKNKTRRFAFIVHPLSMKDTLRHPVIKPVKALAKRFESVLENGLSVLPGFRYGSITGIESKSDGTLVEGDIYGIMDTPRVLMRKSPAKTYEKLIAICEKASSQGADIIGLGAYTKIVGDAGVTVAKNSPIPVTTGNSLSAAATLWAARVAAEKMGFLKPFKKGEAQQARAMVIGATGSIGAVCAKLLSRVVTDLSLCARTADKLLELEEEIKIMSPHCRVKVVVNPNKEARNTDIVFTSTSSHDRRVLDISQVKPGCIICDVSRPLDIREEDAISRPDVLVIESGEIRLPGDNFKVSCDLGVPDSAVYACLAETALLALEGRFETYTLSRHIEYEKVREIYDIARKHGAELASIRGHAGLITDEEIALCKEHAIKALKTWKNTTEESPAP